MVIHCHRELTAAIGWLDDVDTIFSEVLIITEETRISFLFSRDAVPFKAADLLMYAGI
jgi:hypothetical protein